MIVVYKGRFWHIFQKPRAKKNVLGSARASTWKVLPSFWKNVPGFTKKEKKTFRGPAKSPFCGKRKKEFFSFSFSLPLHVAQESHAFVELWSDHCLVNFYLEFRSFFAEDYPSYRQRRLHVTALPFVLHGAYHLSVLVKDRQGLLFGGIQLRIDGCASVVSAI